MEEVVFCAHNGSTCTSGTVLLGERGCRVGDGKPVEVSCILNHVLVGLRRLGGGSFMLDALLATVFAIVRALVAFALVSEEGWTCEFLPVVRSSVVEEGCRFCSRLPRAGTAAGEVRAATTGGVVAMESRSLRKRMRSPVLLLLFARAAAEIASSVYIFRHCVRSTSTNLENVAPWYTNAQEYTDLPLPDWGVPENWCTQEGAKTLQGTGAFLKPLLSSMPSVSFVSDTVMRDGTSTLALLTGLGGAGIVRYDAPLFKPFSPDVGDPICNEQANTTEVTRIIRQRLATVEPPSTFEKAVQQMQSLVGVGAVGNLSGLGAPYVSDTGRLMGVPSFLKLFGQMIFYAFASAVPYPLHGNVSTELMYQLLAWQHWYRSVTSIIPPRAVGNAPLLAAARRALSQDGATVFMGHDGNLDGIAMLLNLSWTAPPYWSGDGRKLLPTPPGSALHLTRSDAGIKVEFAYPVFTSPSGARSNSGVLTFSPLLTLDTLDQLDERIQAGLRAFPGASACFQKGTNHVLSSEESSFR